jgi:iron complex outermembrane receptor protein
VTGIDEIIVTAQKRAQSLDKAATAIVAVRGEDLLASGVSSARDLSNTTPGVQLAQLGSIVNVNVRGVGSSQFSPQGGSAVGFVQDGVPLEGNIGLTSGFYDLERIEVLKGPQGTIYGVDAAAGVLAVVSARPRIGETSGSISGEYGNYDQFKLEGNVNVPLGEQVAARFSGMYHSRDGYVSRTYDDAKEVGVRGQLLYKNDTVSLLLAADWYHEGGVGTGAVALADPATGSRWRGTPDGDPFHSNYFPTKGTDANRDNTYWGVRAELNADLGFANLTILPAYRKIKTDEIQYMSGYRAHAENDISQTSGEIRLDGKTGPLDWMIGGYALWGKRTNTTFTYGPSNFPGGPVNSFFDPAANVVTAFTTFSKNPKESQAIFANATFSVSPEFRLVGGARYSHDKRAVQPFIGSVLTSNLFPPAAPFNTLILVAPSFFPPIGPVGAQLPGIADRPGQSFSLETLVEQAIPPGSLFINQIGPVSNSVSFNHFDFKVGAQYDVTPEVMVYANLSTGYKSGGVNTFVAPPTVTAKYRPETLTALEAGARARFGALHLHVNGYYWWYKNHQEGAIYTLGANGNQLLIQNLPSGKIYGLDVEAGWRATPDDTLGLQVAWLHSDTGAFTIGPPNGPPPAPASQFVEPDGHAYPSSPSWSINANYEHIFHFGEYELAARGEGHYQSKSNLEIRYLPQTRQRAYFTGNLLLTLRPSSQQWYIGGYIRNVTDETYLVSAQKGPGLVPDMWGNLGAPRTYGIRAGFNF